MEFIDLFEQCFLLDYMEKVEEKDECGCAESVKRDKEKLFAQLNEEQIEMVRHLEISIRNQVDYVNFEARKYLLNYAFRLGMDMQKAFDEEDYQ